MRILLIDEHPLDRKLALTILEAGSHLVSAVDSLKEGIRLAEESRPDVIVVSVFPEDLTGEHPFRLNPITRGIPLVAMTALAMKGDRERILSSGYDYYIAKPIRYQDFLKLMDEIDTSSKGKNFS